VVGRRGEILGRAFAVSDRCNLLLFLHLDIQVFRHPLLVVAVAAVAAEGRLVVDPDFHTIQETIYHMALHHGECLPLEAVVAVVAAAVAMILHLTVKHRTLTIQIRILLFPWI